MAEVFVTGANGFIGSHLVPALLQRGHGVTALARPTSDVSALTPLFARFGDRLRLVLGDVRQADALATVLARAEYVYHLAAVLMGSTEPAFRATNVDGTGALLAQLARQRHPGFQRFLLTSSQAAAGPSPDANPIDESAAPGPVSWYGRSKADAEALVRQAGAAGLPVSIVRPVAVYGEREQDLSRGLFPAVSLGLRPRIGFGQKILTVVYVEDLVEGMIAVAEGRASLGRTYFLANPAPSADTEVSDAVARALGKRVLLPVVTPAFMLAPVAVLSQFVTLFTRERPMLTRDKLREVRQRHWAASPAAAARDVAWTARTSLVDGMARATADWRQRKAAAASLSHVPNRERLAMTYTLALAFGVIIEGVAFLGRWYAFTPPWLIFVIVIGVFGGVMGTLTYLTVRWPAVAQFIAGAAVGIGAELANGLFLGMWEFNAEIMSRLPSLGVRAIVLGLPAGLMPPLVTAILRSLGRQRRRIG